MINNNIVLTAEHYLFGDIILPEEFHEALSNFMKTSYNQSHCVVLYKRLSSFGALLDTFPQLPDIDKKEFIVTQSGTLYFTPNYFCSYLDEVFVINFVSDQIVSEAIKCFFGNFVSLEFHDSFKKFLEKAFKNSNKVVLSSSNFSFIRFLKKHIGIPLIGKKKLIIYSSGKMLFTENSSVNEFVEISLNTEET